MTNTDIEASVIGGLLIGGYTPDASDVIATLDDSAFSVELYRRAFGEIKRQAKQRGLIDGMMVAEAMGNDYVAHIMETTRKCPSAANLKGYARVVADYHKVRRFTELMDAGKREISSAGNHELALNAINQFMASLTDIDRPGDEIRPMHIRDVLDGYQELLEKRVRQGEESDTLKTGIPELDQITGGINPVDLVIVAARPGMGKTEFALTVAEGVGRQQLPGSKDNRGVLIFSMEMDANQIIERQLAGAGNLPVSDLRNPAKMDDEGWAKVTLGMKRLLDLDVWIVDASKMNVEQIRAIAERHKRNHPALSLILVDYLGLIEKPKADRNDLAIAHISGSLKRMAKDLKTPVMSLSQLSRDVEKRPKGQRRPTNADLRDSGSIEQDADSIIMLYREAVYDDESPAAKLAEIIVTKNRFGQLGTVYQAFVNGHFKPTDQEEAAKLCRTKPEQPQQQSRRYNKGADV
ncbi:DNA helicase [Pantoea sp. RIT-PI-b]|uniref:replicative DNA helicase n=1 Tax=Pantoea sp. RIT-PI-b TaxID=1681195 RepID=UPI000675CDAC|nr:replicative DNA helicase [Pantoea sp. RIT-PI-b]KNC11559.1 DNA helicase [Pantoea sp. RIT-PI-b]